MALVIDGVNIESVTIDGVIMDTFKLDGVTFLDGPTPPDPDTFQLTVGCKVDGIREDIGFVLPPFELGSITPTHYKDLQIGLLQGIRLGALDMFALGFVGSSEVGRTYAVVVNGSRVVFNPITQGVEVEGVLVSSGDYIGADATPIINHFKQNIGKPVTVKIEFVK